MLSRELLRRLPKAELHVHLDGSLRPETMIDLARAARVDLPARDPDALRRYMLVDDARDLEDYLKRFDVTIALLQDPAAIERVAYEMVEDARADGLRYLEVRYCPVLSTRAGLSIEDAVAAEWRGLARGQRDFKVRTAIINCSLRHFAPEVSRDLALRSVALRGQGVVAFDLAGPEAGHPAAVHRAAFDVAEQGGLEITVHAGEAAGAESIAQAVHLCHATRIGHGTRLSEDPVLKAQLRDRRVVLETNISSNVQTHAVASAAAHPVRGYLAEGLAATLCTDSWLMSGTSLSNEYWIAAHGAGHGACGDRPDDPARIRRGVPPLA